MLSGLDPDPDWSVRAALATVLGTLPPESGCRVCARCSTIPTSGSSRPCSRRSRGCSAPDAADDPARAAEGRRSGGARRRGARLGELKPTGQSQALAEAYRCGQRDTTYVGAGGGAAALAELTAPDAVPVLTEALADKDWAVRVRRPTLLKTLDPSSDADERIRPAPTARPPTTSTARRASIAPPVSTQVYIDTDRGTIQIELAVLDAPLTVENFVALARRGFFDGLSVHRVVPDFVVQAGDPRGDGEGGPGYTIRDELNQRPYLRGTLGMALDWADTGGSQFFITHSPQPHLDAKYTVFGRVLSGMDVVDRIQPGDVIRRVRVWDGTQ